MRSMLLVSLLCVVACALSQAVDCAPAAPPNCPAVPLGCPNNPVNGNCSVDTTYLVSNAGCTDPAGKPHQAITLQVGNTLKVFAIDGLPFKILEFKAYQMAGGACNYDGAPLPNVPLGNGNFLDDGASVGPVVVSAFDLVHVLTAEKPGCYEVAFRRSDGCVIDPHIIVSGNNLIRKKHHPDKDHEPKPKSANN